MSEVSPIAELLGHAFYHFERIKPLLPTYCHLLVSALFPIWTGAHASLSRPSSAAKPPKKDTEDGGDDDDGEEDQGLGHKMEGLEPSDALMFPLTAGLTLGGLYLVIKWLEDPAVLNKILSFYFSQMGVFFAIAFLKDAFLIVRSLIFPRYYRQGGKLWTAKQSERMFTANASDDSHELGFSRTSPLPGVFGRLPLPNAVHTVLWSCRNASYERLKLRAHVRGLFAGKGLIGLLDVLSGIFALSAVGYFAFVTKPWWLTNFLGFSFCYGALQFMSPSTFWTGSLILGSLFLYDIYFVFFTPMMVTVATKLDVPIKLLFPRPPSPSETPDTVSLAMLGLGDVVIPGMMVGLALRFDLFLYYKRKGTLKTQAEEPSQEIVKPVYQPATGAWGERFWAPPVVPREPEFEPPYHDARSFPKTYFKASIVGYVFGMIATLLAMQISNHAQPALLYLVPGVLISLWGTALFRGEIQTMWEFSDAAEDGDDEDDKKKEKNEDRPRLQGQKSLFMRIWSGDLKALTSPKESPSQKEEEKTNSSTSDSAAPAESKSSGPGHDEDKVTTDDLELVSFSISFLRKSHTHLDAPPFKETASENGNAVIVPNAGDRGDEPPMKRRRREAAK